MHLPRGTAIRRFDISSAEGDLGREVFRTLDRLDIPVHLKKQSVAKGHRQVVHVRGVVRGEHIRVWVRHRLVAGARARGKRVTLRFPVTGKVGRARVTVRGEFPKIRHGSATFRVTR